LCLDKIGRYLQKRLLGQFGKVCGQQGQQRAGRQRLVGGCRKGLFAGSQTTA